MIVAGVGLSLAVKRGDLLLQLGDVPFDAGQLPLDALRLPLFRLLHGLGLVLSVLLSGGDGLLPRLIRPELGQTAAEIGDLAVL